MDGKAMPVGGLCNTRCVAQAQFCLGHLRSPRLPAGQSIRRRPVRKLPVPARFAHRPEPRLSGGLQAELTLNDRLVVLRSFALPSKLLGIPPCIGIKGNEMDQGLINGIDVRLLRTTLLLLRERNVSRVAMMLGHSQPAVSASLKKARVVFADALLVRSGQSLVPTVRGEQVADLIAETLEKLAELVGSEDRFDPFRAEGRIRILVVNCFGGFLVPAIGARLRAEAPGLAVDFFAPSENADLAKELEQGVDLVISSWPAPRGSLRSAPLLQCGISCLMRTQHPFARRKGLTMKDYVDCDHVSPTPITNALYSPIDSRLAKVGVRRRVMMSVPEYAQIPELLKSSDLVFTTGTPYATYIAEAFGDGKLRVFKAPVELEQMQVHMLWHERVQNGEQHRWLRQLVRDVARQADRHMLSAEAETCAENAGSALGV
ncbi:LysR family transcriptional regulator [Citreicella sp. C3M06]|uniref:LysR family transcriptional regulator n=1 Tax=Citreicella sp. C3M06 TaxID=2841564 RepID=UPI001C0A3916|nr:LysR family transcriptional regulator [Citreicella sp. C3M06]MBU2959316.1 LysR family transcriptional regulator [Citreicella sp. C3M06]